MPDEPLHQPHDKLFKSTFGDPANAAAFLRGQISSGISARLDWERLRLEPGSFVDSQFRSSESDLLFSSSLEGTDCLIYVLFEHQRVLDPWIALRLLRYMVRIWEGFRLKQPQAVRLPVILPVVLSQNALRWELAPRFAALLDIPPELAEESAAFIPDFLFKLVQLADLPFEKIVGTPAGILVLRTLKAEQIEKLLGSEVWDESLIQQALPTFEMILRYILSQTEMSGPVQNRTVPVQNRTPPVQNRILEAGGGKCLAIKHVEVRLRRRLQDTALLESNRSGRRCQRGFRLRVACRRSAFT
jgi:hypothetical protein